MLRAQMHLSVKLSNWKYSTESKHPHNPSHPFWRSVATCNSHSEGGLWTPTTAIDTSPCL